MGEISANRPKGTSFYPDYLFEVLVVALLSLELVLVLGLLFPPPVGRPIDLVGQYQPRPEWYFLWIYEFIRYFPGKSAWVGAVLIPLGLVVLLASVPFIDRYGETVRRRCALLIMASMAALSVALTLAGWFR